MNIKKLLAGLVALALAFGAERLGLLDQVTENGDAGFGGTATAPAQAGSSSTEAAPQGSAPTEVAKPAPSSDSKPKATPEPEPKSGTEKPVANDDEIAKIAKAIKYQQSGFMVQVPGEVVHLLPDDNEGSRHQRFLMELSDGTTVKVAHNIDLAPYVPVRKGDMIRVKGQYEFNDKGGVLHWTHHDPAGRHEGGWILYDGKHYE